MPTLAQVQEYLDNPKTAPQRRHGTGNLAIAWLADNRPKRPDIQARFIDPVTGKRRFVGTGVNPEKYKGKNAVERAVADALDWLDKKIHNLGVAKVEADAQEAKSLAEGWTVRQVCEDYLKTLQQETKANGKKRSMRSYDDARMKLDQHILPWIGEELADAWAGMNDRDKKVGARNVAALREAIANTPRRRGNKNKPLGVCSIQSPMRVLLAAYNYAHKKGNVVVVPPIEFEPEPIREGYFEEEEIDALLPFFSDSAKPLFLAAVNAGLRSEVELLGTTWADVKWKKGGILVPGERTKNGKPRMVPMLDRGAMDMLRESYEIWREHFSHLHQRVFFWRETRFGATAGEPIASFYHCFKSAMVQAAQALNRPDLLDRSPHDCRRTFVTALSERPGLTLEDIMELSGHLSRNMAMRYNVKGRQAAAKFIAMRDGVSTDEVAKMEDNVIQMPSTPAPQDDIPNDLASLKAAGLPDVQIAHRLGWTFAKLKTEWPKLRRRQRDQERAAAARASKAS